MSFTTLEPIADSRPDARFWCEAITPALFPLFELFLLGVKHSLSADLLADEERTDRWVLILFFSAVD